MLLKYNNTTINALVNLPSSKSISNRLLILNEVLNLNLQFSNLSAAKDTQELILALAQIKENKNHTIDIGHAGTDMRFLTALLSTKEGEWILTGSERMKQRPIAELVNALKQIGAQISYLEKEGFPPLKINGAKLNGKNIVIDGSISSQFISALLLIAPLFENGFEIKLKNEIVSWPYVLMTITLLKQFGVNSNVQDSTIKIQKSNHQLTNNSLYSNQNHNYNLTPNSQRLTFNIESDWTSASYWYSIVALSKNAEITLTGLEEKSSQADSVLPELYKHFGVTSEFKNGHLLLSKNLNLTTFFEYNFTNCPDIAQTIAVTCFGLKINCKLTGLQTLKLKETDRISALKNELEKFNATVKTTEDSISIQHSPHIPQHSIVINTYNDHRMAMSFAPLALITSSINIQNPEVVDKSYPTFWNDLKLIGIKGV
jgi:3-phosphoshikimate 1-carboxyvinyltransferase